MAIIPRVPEQIRMNVSSPVPIASAESARTTGEAQAAVGKGLFNLGGDLADEYKRMRETQNFLDFREASDNLNTIYLQTSEEAKRESAPDGSDMNKLFTEKADPMVSEVMNKFRGHPETYAKLNVENSKLRNDVEVQLGLKSVEKLEESNFTRLDGLSEKASDRVRQNPTEQMAASEFTTFAASSQEMVNNRQLTPDNYARIMEIHKGRVADNMILGLEAHGRYGDIIKYTSATQEKEDVYTELDPDLAKSLGFIDPKEAKELIDKGETYKLTSYSHKGKKISPEAAAIMESLKPERKAQYSSMARAKLKEKTEMHLADINAEVKSYQAVALTRPMSQAETARVKALVARSSMTQPAIRRVLTEIDTTAVVSQQVQLLATSHRDEQPKIEADLDKMLKLSQSAAESVDPRMKANHSDLSVEAIRNGAKAKFQEAVRDMQAAQEKDAAAFVHSKDSKIADLYRASLSGTPVAVQTYAQAMESKQKALGIPADSIRVLTKDEAFARGQMLRAAPDSFTASKEIEKMQTQYGKFFPKVMQEIASESKDMANYAATVYAPASTRSQLLDAVKNENSINEMFKRNPDNAAHQKSINTAVTNRMASFSDALIGSSNSTKGAASIASLSKAIELQVKRDLTRNSNANVAELTMKAYDQIVASQYKVVAGVVVPRNIGNREPSDQIVSAFVRVNSNSGAFSELGVVTPDSYKGKEEKFINEILPRQHKWMTSPDQTGVVLMYPDPNTGEYVQAKNKYGKVVESSYEDMMLRPQARVANAAKSIAQQFGLGHTR